MIRFQKNALAMFDLPRIPEPLDESCNPLYLQLDLLHPGLTVAFSPEKSPCMASSRSTFYNFGASLGALVCSRLLMLKSSMFINQFLLETE